MQNNMPKFQIIEIDGLGKQSVHGYYYTREEAEADLPADFYYNAGSESQPSMRSFNYFIIPITD